MTRLIDADALREQFKDRSLEDFTYLHFIDAIDNAPTVPLPDFKEGYKQAIIDGKTNFSRPKGKWKVIGRNVPNNIWHVFCPKCNCDMFTEFTSYCPNCGEPKKEINIAELNMRGEEDVT